LKGEGNIESKIERTIKLKHKWLKLFSVSAMMLIGCNNSDGDNNPAPPDTEDPIEDPKDATDPDNRNMVQYRLFSNGIFYASEISYAAV
jgi:hypothetical protein